MVGRLITFLDATVLLEGLDGITPLPFSLFLLLQPAPTPELFFIYLTRPSLFKTEKAKVRQTDRQKDTDRKVVRRPQALYIFES